MFRRLETISILIVIFLCPQFGFGQTEDTPVQLTILHTNDHHGHLLAFDLPGQKQVGGMAARMTLVREVRQEVAAHNGYLLILDGGDVNTGDPLSDMFTAEPDILLMNSIGYQAMALGNHEFDVPLPRMLQQKEWAQFHFLSANVFYKDTQDLLFSPVVVWQAGDVKIAVFGITVPETPELSTCGDNPKLVFVKAEEVIVNILELLRGKVDFIIAVMHEAHPVVLDLARAFPEIDIIIGAHTHLPVAQPVEVGKTLVAEAGHSGMMMGRWDLCFQNRKLVRWKYELIGINLTKPIEDGNGKVLCAPFSRSFAPAPEVGQLLAPYVKKSEELLNEEIGQSAVDLPMSIARCPYPRSSPLGNLVADAMRDGTGADIALQNVGGVRTDLLKGSITYRDVRKVLPFANTIVTYDITGKEVMDILSIMAQRNPVEGTYFEVAGITLGVRGKAPVDVKVAGQPLDPARVYKVAINSFIARGGDGYKIFLKLPNKRDSGLLLHEIFAGYLRKSSPIENGVGEIRMQWLRE